MGFCVSDPGNKFYRAAIEKEMWIMSNSGTPTWPPSIDLHPIISAYINKEVAGIKSDGETDWFEMLLARYEPVESLGTGAGIHEKTLIEKGVVKFWDCVDLVTSCKNLQTQNQRRNEFITGDLNFIELLENSYPLVFCNGTLHHIINLEHLLFQINRTLTNDGFFIVNEYVGENRWQWDEEKIQFINKEIRRHFRTKYPKLKVFRPKSYKDRPLESIRSSEIPSILHAYFQNTSEFELITCPVLYPIINSLGLGPMREYLINNPGALAEILSFAVKLDKECTSQHKDFRPTQLIGIYRKSGVTQPVRSLRWSEREIEYQLSPNVPFLIRARKFLGRYDAIRTLYKSIKKIVR